MFSSPTGGTGVGPGGRDKAPPLSCWLCRMGKGEKSPRPGRFEASLGFFFCRPDALWRKATAFEKVFNPPCFLSINRYIEKCYLHPEQLISSIGYFYPPEIGTIICI